MKIKIIIIIGSLVLASIISYLTFNIKSTDNSSCYKIVYSGWPFKSNQVVYKNCNNLDAGIGVFEFPFRLIFVFNLVVFFVPFFLIFCGIFRRQITRVGRFMLWTFIFAIIGFSIAIYIIVHTL